MHRIFIVRMKAFQICLINAILYYNVVSGTAGFATTVVNPSTGIGSITYNRQSNLASLANGNNPLAGRPSFVKVGQNSNFDVNKTTPRVRGVRAQAWFSNRGPVNGGNEKPWYWSVFNRDRPDQKDDLKESGDEFTNIYRYTLGLLTLGMQKWLDDSDRDPDAIGRYLGYSAPTVNVINAAMTELLGQQRNGTMTVNDLADTYYYSCDMENVRDHGPNDVAAVTDAFRRLLRSHRPSMAVENMTEDQMVTGIKSSLDRIGDRVKPEYGVTVSLMKNRMFVESTNKTAVNRLADTVADEKTGQTFHQLAESCSKNATGTDVNRDHLTVLYHLIPKMFRYSYDYVQLLLKLYEFELDETDMDTVRSFATFTERFTSMFVDRYFEFSCENDLDLHFYLKPVIEFCNPKSTDRGKADNPDISNFNSYKSKMATEYYRNYAKSITSNALEALMFSFNFEISVEETITGRTYSDETLTKKDVLDLMTKNIDEGFEILDEYSRHFNV